MLLSMLLRFFVVHVIVVWNIWSITVTEASSAFAPSEAPSVAPSAPTAIKSSAPSITITTYFDPTGTSPICNICTNGSTAVANDGSNITKPDGTIAYDTVKTTCLQLYTDGLMGNITSYLCPLLRDPTVVDIIVLCGCIGPNTDGPTETPTKLLSLFPSYSPHVTAIPSVAPSSSSNNNNNNIKSPTSSAAATKMGAMSNNNCFPRMVITSFWSMLVVVATYVTTSANY